MGEIRMKHLTVLKHNIMNCIKQNGYIPYNIIFLNFNNIQKYSIK